MNIIKICFIMHHYSPTCFGRLSDLRQGVIQAYKQYANNFTQCVIVICC